MTDEQKKYAYMGIAYGVLANEFPKNALYKFCAAYYTARSIYA